MKKKAISLFTATIGVIILAVISLVFTNMRDSIFGTPFDVTVAQDGATLSSSFLPISGKAKHARNIMINGRSIALDRNGNFIDAVLLSPGYNTVEIALKDQFGKEKIRTYHLVFEETDAVAQNAPTNYQQ